MALDAGSDLDGLSRWIPFWMIGLFFYVRHVSDDVRINMVTGNVFSCCVPVEPVEEETCAFVFRMATGEVDAQEVVPFYALWRYPKKYNAWLTAVESMANNPNQRPHPLLLMPPFSDATPNSE